MKSIVRILIACFALFSLSACGVDSESDLQTPSSAKDFEGEDYKNVMIQLKDAGFANIETEILDDLITGKITKEGEVEQVSINGETDFSEDTWFPEKAKVSIAYHSFPEEVEVAEEAKVAKKEEIKQVAEEKKKAEEARQKELTEQNPNKTEQTRSSNSAPDVPSGQDYVVVNNNVPYFSNEDISSIDAYHKNGSFDNLGRVTVANALVGVEIMPAEERGSISHIEPSGWNQARYAGIGAGGWLYNRSHLIGHQMTGNDDPKNLMTGTRHFNMAMLEFENFVANYVESTENHVRYRVTPVYKGNNLVASGIYMEGFSIEDNGESIMFNIFVPNRQPNVEINYADGSSVGSSSPAQDGEIKDYQGNKNTKKDAEAKKATPSKKPKKETTKPDPEPSESSNDVSKVDTNGNGKVTISEAKAAGFSMPIKKGHWLYPYMIDRDGDGMVGE